MNGSAKGQDDELATRVLVALVEGYSARAGMKDRIRALNEWEIARRSGYVELSYAEYLEHPLRDDVTNALLALQRRGLVSVWDRGPKYDSYVPTSAGTAAATSASPASEPPSDGVASRPTTEADVRRLLHSVAPGDPDEPASANQDAILARLDEIIRLLRSIDTRLAR